jgi:putative restriction endonuclease
MHTSTSIDTLTEMEIRDQLTAITMRQLPHPKSRQVPFTLVETLLCYGLFFLINPHSYGGANIDRLPSIVPTLALFFCRTPSSLTNKMLNLDGSRLHGGRDEPYIFATLGADPALYLQLYRTIILIARELSIGEDVLPDFLQQATSSSDNEGLLGQDDLPTSSTILLAQEEGALESVDRAFSLGDTLTEKLVERKIRLAQHRFARAVLQNCGHSCVFCGFAPLTIPERSSLLRASHIKPWAISNSQERVDVRNGLIACPTHDVAFDRGYITIEDDLSIRLAAVLQRSITQDPGVRHYFGEIIHTTVLLPQKSKTPSPSYLAYHREHVFKGTTDYCESASR